MGESEVMAQGFVIIKSSRVYEGGPGRYGVQKTIAEAKRIAEEDGNPVGFDIYRYHSKSRRIYGDLKPVAAVNSLVHGTFGALLSGGLRGGTESCIERASEEAMKSLGHRKAADFDTQNLLVSWYGRGKACGAKVDLKYVSAETAHQAMYFAAEQAEIHVDQWVPDTSANESVRGSAARHAMSAFREGFKATVYARLVDKMRGGSLGDSISAKKLRGGRVAFTRTVSKKEIAELKRVMKRVLK